MRRRAPQDPGVQGDLGTPLGVQYLATQIPEQAAWNFESGPRQAEADCSPSRTPMASSTRPASTRLRSEMSNPPRNLVDHPSGRPQVLPRTPKNNPLQVLTVLQGICFKRREALQVSKVS
jgi:hypothetical protein